MQPSQEERFTHRYGEPIAVIGMSCRYAGAEGLRSFWEMLREGREGIGRVPPERWDADDYPASKYPGMEWGGFVADIDRFDASFFGINPRKAHRMDPQQRMILETAWEALEDAGLPAETVSGTRTAVLVGQSYPDYTVLQCGPTSGGDIYLLAGCAASVTSGRLGHALELRGINAVVDTACSSSLVAIHLAAHSLWSGDADVALVGGVSAILMPHPSSAFAQARVLAPDGKCRAFDANAAGLVRGEGVGVVILKPLSRALADRDRIYALVRGTAVNHDGRGEAHLMHPSGEAQEAVIRDAYRRAGVAPSLVDYVEAHGTGTVVGDYVEAQALGAVVRTDRPADRPCYIGSLKGNVGHAEPAAGIAGFIKAVLCLWHREIPPVPHLKEPNPKVQWEDLRLAVSATRLPWPDRGRPALAGVSSFGINGTNAHIVLEEAPRAVVADDPPAVTRPSYLLPISARGEDALREMASRYRDLLSADGDSALGDLCYTAAVRRTHHDHRLAVVASSAAGLAEMLDGFVRGEIHPRLSSGPIPPGRQPRTVFLFSGQGSNWPRMGHDLMANEPVFGQAIDTCQAAMAGEFDWQLRDVLSDPDGSLLSHVDVAQPALFAVQVSLAELWRSWGVVPKAVAGHSMGEVAAAYVAGALTLRDAGRVICRRSKLLRTMTGSGEMAVVDLSLDEARDAIAAWGDALSIATNNGPTTCVISGDASAVEEFTEKLGRQGIFCRTVKTEIAGHSRAIDPILPELRHALSGLEPQSLTIPFYSTVTGASIAGEDLDADYWVRNLREPVLLATVMRRLLEEEHDAVIEIGPHPALLGYIQQSAQQAGRTATVLPSLHRDHPQSEVMLGSLGALHVLGQPVSWPGLYPSGRFAELPRYAWQRERFWLNPPADGRRAKLGPHPLLGQHLLTAVGAGTHLWTTELQLDLLPYLGDHRLRGAVVLPAAAYLEMALSAGAHVLAGGPCDADGFEFTAPMFVPADGGVAAQVVVTADPGARTASARLYSRPDGESGAWTSHAHGLVRRHDADLPHDDVDLESLRTRCPHSIDPAAFYRSLDGIGMQYGPAFRGIRELWHGDGEAFARIEAPVDGAEGYGVHPALLDACLQVFGAALPDAIRDAGDPFLPVRIHRLALRERPQPIGGWAHAQLRESSAERLTGDIRLFGSDGQVLLAVEGLTVQRVAGRASASTAEDWLYSLTWEPKTHPGPAARAREPDVGGDWIVLSDDGVTAAGICRSLEERGHRCVQVHDPADFGTHLDEVLNAASGCQGIVYGPLRNADVAIGLLHVTQALASRSWAGPAPRLHVLTAGAQAVGGECAIAVTQAPAWGVGRTIRHEHPEFGPILIDLPPDEDAVEIEGVLAELLGGDDENEIALRPGGRYVARLVRAGLPPVPSDIAPERRPFRLELTRTGSLDELHVQVAPRRAPGQGEIEIEVLAAGLTYPDVLAALSQHNGAAGQSGLGAEVSGRVTAVGEGAAGLTVGDEVIAITGPGTGFGSFVTVPAAFVRPKPGILGHPEAATLPVAFMTAYHSLINLARLRPADRVLIHSAAGGVGGAAVQIAQMVGAEIYATAGTPEKRAYLRSLGVQHVMDSRSLAFAGVIQERTGGRGVDVVLNSLGGQALERSLDVLAPGGRFVEIGKRGGANGAQEMPPLRGNVSFFSVDIDDLAERDVPLLSSVFDEILRHLSDGTLRCLPCRVFPVSEIADAFRSMADAGHIGKIAVSIQDEQVRPEPPETAVLRADGSYLITGGLGGLGLSVAQWMAERGARHLILVGRSAPGRDAAAVLEGLRRGGARVEVMRADVADERQMRTVLSDSASRMPPLRGVVHAAGVLDDGVLAQLTPERFERVMAPKVTGAWNLHTLTRDADLDFFVLFSSAAAVLGSPGQANYAAANAFLDALAHHRREQGLPGLSINWGTWARVGLATLPGRADRLANFGIASLEPDEGTRALGYLLERPLTQAAVMRFDVVRWRTVYPTDLPLLATLQKDAAALPEQRDPTAEGERIRAAVRDATREDAVRLLQDFLCDRLGRVLGLAPGRRLDPQIPLNRVGIDSLMAIEIRNRIQLELGVWVRVAIFFRQPTIAQLADQLAEQLQAESDAQEGEWEEGKL